MDVFASIHKGEKTKVISPKEAKAKGAKDGSIAILRKEGAKRSLYKLFRFAVAPFDGRYKECQSFLQLIIK
jgi:hypothetical protein